jgi:methanol---5-hydroxybenzimidazolylcobamide Co-methyltransferase
MHTQKKTFSKLAIEKEESFLFGKAPHPLICGHGVEIGNGRVVPEINFTLPPIEITSQTWSEVKNHYQEMIDGVTRRAIELEVPSLLVEFETLPPMTIQPSWGAEITRILSDRLREVNGKYGIHTALRLTPNDTREHERPPLMRKGKYWDGMMELFRLASSSGADMIGIESTGGKEVCDEALLNADLRTVVFALGILGARDMEFIWDAIVTICRDEGIIASGDSACGFANTAMVLANQKYIPQVFAAVVRVATVPRSLVAYEMGALGPSKDCAYEGPYMKAIAGVPISMEGRSAACAHLSPLGNISQAVCDCWSNESVQNIRLLSANAPVVSLEQLAYDCRLMNTVLRQSDADALKLRDWLVESDAALDPQAYVLRPDVVLRISEEIIKETSPYSRTRKAVIIAIEEISKAIEQNLVKIPERERPWLNRLRQEALILPESEESFIEEMLKSDAREKFLPSEYGIL